VISQKSTPAGTQVFQSLQAEKRDRVLQAALQEFAANGYRKASMNSIVKKACISKGSLFWYFRSKDSLFGALVDSAVDQVKDSMRRVRTETSGMLFFPRLEMFIKVGIRFIDDHPLLARIYFHLLQSGEAPFSKERIFQLRSLGATFFSDLIEEGMRGGELRPDIRVEQVAFLMNSMLEALLRAYYTEFLAEGLGLYRADQAVLQEWIMTATDLLSSGIAIKNDRNR
jgi:AcrR family transcriptional regulator